VLGKLARLFEQLPGVKKYPKLKRLAGKWEWEAGDGAEGAAGAQVS
jgi:hypothetical protein